MKTSIERRILKKYILMILLISIMIVGAQSFDNDLVSNLILDSQENVINSSFFLPMLIFLLRLISIVIPIIPGTYCSVIAGYLFGFKQGLILIFIADFVSCSTSFFIARKLGKSFIQKFLGAKQMKRVENISHKYIEGNIFLMTGLLMTQFFDFVCYAIGLTNIPWRKFMPSLIISILVSDSPFIAGGYSISKLKEVTLTNILEGDVQTLSGPYLIIFIISILIILGLGILNAFLNRNPA